MFNLFKSKKNEKLYKFVFKTGGYYDHTLLITAIDEIEAVKKLYRQANNKVESIIEFTEVIPKKGADDT